METGTRDGSSSGRRLLALSARAGFGLAMLAVMAGGIMLLHARAEDEQTVSVRAPMPVVTERLDLESSYEVSERYTGRVAPARKTDAAFERDGLVLRVEVDEGDEIAQGDILAQLDTELLVAARSALEAELLQVQADRQLALRTLDRQKTLASQGNASQQRLDEARFAVDALNANLANLEARIRQIAIDIEKSSLRAPFAGTIAARWRDEGAVVEAGMPIVTLLETDRPEARIGVPPRIAGELDIGGDYRLVTADTTVDATLMSLRPDLAMSTRTVEARFRLADRALVPFGDLIRLEWPRRIERSGAWVPLSALMEEASGLWTLLTVVDGADGLVVASETVQILHVVEGRAFVQGSFADGQSFVAEGVNRVTPGQSVAVQSVAVQSLGAGS